MKNIRVQCSPLTETIYAGRINAAGDAWAGQKTDVTSDVLGAVIQKVGVGNTITVNKDGKPAFEITVKAHKEPCQHCKDTGDMHGQGYLDCIHCDAASQKAAGSVMTPPTQHDLTLAEAVREAAAKIVWPDRKVWNEEEKAAMEAAYNRANDRHGFYETLFAVAASICKRNAAAIRDTDLSALLAAHIHPTFNGVNPWLLSLSEEEQKHINSLGKWELADKVWDAATRAAHIHPTPQDARDVQRSATVGPCEDSQLNGMRPIAMNRDMLGRLVRSTWVKWARTQPNPKPSWLLPYDELAECDKEADRQIGETIARWTLIGDAASHALMPYSHGTRVESAPSATASEGLSEGLAGEPVAWMNEQEPDDWPAGTPHKCGIGGEHFGICPACERTKGETK